MRLTPLIVKATLLTAGQEFLLSRLSEGSARHTLPPQRCPRRYAPRSHTSPASFGTREVGGTGCGVAARSFFFFFPLPHHDLNVQRYIQFEPHLRHDHDVIPAPALAVLPKCVPMELEYNLKEVKGIGPGPGDSFCSSTRSSRPGACGLPRRQRHNYYPHKPMMTPTGIAEHAMNLNLSNLGGGSAW